jgi:Ras-related protein Rab-5C
MASDAQVYNANGSTIVLKGTSMSWEEEGRNSAPRIIFIGDSSVGKTSIIHRIRTGAFLDVSTPTVGTGVIQFSARTELGQKMFQLWDTAGQEVYRKIIPIYFRGADAAIIVFSFSDPSSYANLDGWLDELQANTDPDTTTILVGNKADMERRVSEVDARTWANDHHFPVLFVSAKSGEGIDGLKTEIVDQYMRKKRGHRPVNRIELGLPEKRKAECC